LTHIQGLLSALGFNPKRYRTMPAAIGIEVDDAFETGEPIKLRARTENITANLFSKITCVRTGADIMESNLIRKRSRWHTVEFPPLPEGTYRVSVKDTSGKSNPVSDVFVVLKN
jgi:hypothetical protein